MELSDEEKEAIEQVNYIIEEVRENTKEETPTYIFNRDIKCLPILLKLISKLQQESKENYWNYIKEKNKYDKLLVLYNGLQKENNKLKKQNLDILTGKEYKENEDYKELKEFAKDIAKENELQSKVIDEMAIHIDTLNDELVKLDDDISYEPCISSETMNDCITRECKYCIKQYFINKVKGENNG